MYKIQWNERYRKKVVTGWDPSIIHLNYLNERVALSHNKGIRDVTSPIYILYFKKIIKIYLGLSEKLQPCAESSETPDHGSFQGPVTSTFRLGGFGYRVDAIKWIWFFCYFYFA